MKSDRVIWITFFLILAVVLFLLFLVFGKKPEGPSIDPTSTPDFSELGDFEGSISREVQDPQLRMIPKMNQKHEEEQQGPWQLEREVQNVQRDPNNLIPYWLNTPLGPVLSP